MRLEFSSEFNEVIAKLNNSESLDSFHKIMISTRPIDIGMLVESIKDTKHNVIELTINSIKLTADEIKKLEDVFTHCTSLESLDLSNNELTSKEAEILAGILANNKTVKSLSLNNNKIGDNGLKAFAKIAENSSIESLNFSENNISDKGFKFWVEALKKNTSLTDFNFYNNKIHDEGVKALAEALSSNTSIKKFTIAVEGLTNETRELLGKIVNDKAITVKQYPATKLPDALDVWLDEVIPALQLKPTEQLVDKAPSVSPETILEPNESKPPPEIIVENKSNPETILELLDKYNSKFYSLLEGYNNSLDKQSMEPNSALKETQAVIVFGNSTNDKNILTNLLAHKTLKLEKSGGKLIIASSSSKFSQDIILSNKPVINIIKGADGLIVCDSNYPNDNLSKSETTINALYLQKILRNDTKFVFTVADSETKFTTIWGNSYEKEFLSQVKKLAILLKEIKLTKDNFSFVVTGALSEKEDIRAFIDRVYDDGIFEQRPRDDEQRKMREKETQIMYFLQKSICVVRPFSCGELTLEKDLQAILNKPLSILTTADNKITTDAIDIKDITGLQTYIKRELKENIVKLGNQTIAKWNKEKDSVFISESDLCSARSGQKVFSANIILSDTKPLNKLIEVFKKLATDSFYPTKDDTTKFLALNNVLYQVLGDQELANKLINSIDYLKYLAEINVGDKALIAEERLFSSNNPDNWFKMLADGVLSIGDINKQLVESFKTAMQNSFCYRLETFIKEFSNSTKILTEDTIKNIYSLKLLQSILVDEDIKKGINSFTVIEYMLNITSPTGGADLVRTNITVLKELVIECNPNYGPKILTEIWQEFVDLKAIKDINENIHNIMYEKLITAKNKMDTNLYCKLLELISLNDVGSADLSNPHIKGCYPKLAEIYCKIGSVGFGGTKVFEDYKPPEVIGNTVDFEPAFIE